MQEVGLNSRRGSHHDFFINVFKLAISKVRVSSHITGRIANRKCFSSLENGFPIFPEVIFIKYSDIQLNVISFIFILV